MPATATAQDIPAAGRSLFDILTTVETPDGPRLQVPFPFEKLRSLVKTAGALSDHDVAETLLPLGRSLQRQAAAPDFFTSPRLVLGVVGAPVNADPATALIMKDRLYLGYQPKAEILEVISFNERAGRFEFQIVENYARGKKSRTLQARRSLCLGCHQNAGPIFSDPPWSETPANPAIATRLTKTRGAAPPSSSEITKARQSAAMLHRSAAAANRLLHAARYWSGACSAPRAAPHCKVHLLSTSLEHRLSGRRSFGQGNFPTRRETEIFHQESLRDAWPAGFVIASPFITDIDPSRPADDAAQKRADPLTERPAFGILDVADPGTNNQIIELLGDFFTNGNIRWLENALLNLAEDVGAQRHVLQVPCTFTSTAVRNVERAWRFTCVGRAPGFPRMSGTVTTDGSTIPRIQIDELSIELLDYRRLSTQIVTQSRDSSGERKLTLRPTDPATGLRPRNGDGWVIASVDLSWPGAVASSKLGFPETGVVAAFTIIDDIKRFRTTLGTLSSYKMAGAKHAVTEGSFRRHEIMRALAIRLGRSVPDWCCEPAADLPPPIAAAKPAAMTVTGLSTGPGPAHPSLQAFHRACGACHAGRAAAPANFLHGSSERQIQAIAGCAPRISRRLKQWETTNRQLPPMPPPSELTTLGMTPEQWLESSDYRRIQRFTTGLAVPDAGQGIVEYRALPDCAPPGP